MKIYFILILFSGFCFSQATGFAIYGVGEEIQNTDPASLALGNSRFFSGNSKNISTGSPSSLWRSALTRFTIHSGMNFLTISQFPEQFQHNLTSFSLLFPVGNKKVFGFGMHPLYRTNKLEITDKNYQFIGADESITGSPIAFKNNYFVDGGIFELFLNYSRKLSSNYSVGIAYSFLFGNQYTDDKLYTYDVEVSNNEIGISIGEIVENGETLYLLATNKDSTSIRKYRQFSGKILSLEGRYTQPKQEWVMRVSFNGNIDVKTINVQSTENTALTNYFNKSSGAIISNIGLGYQYKFAENLGTILELHKKYPFNIPENAALFNTLPPGEISFHFGSYYQIQNPRIGFWNNLNLRGGLYLKELNFTGDKVLDYGATLGLGIEYLGNTQTIDLALRAGKKESRILKGDYENYISFHIGITTGEKWFMKRRRK